MVESPKSYIGGSAHYPPQVLLISQETVDSLTRQCESISNSNSISPQQTPNPKTCNNTDNDENVNPKTFSKTQSPTTDYPTIATINTQFAMQSNYTPYNSNDEFDCNYINTDTDITTDNNTDTNTDTEIDEFIDPDEAKINFVKKQLETDIEN